LLCTIYFVDIGTFTGDVPPPPVDEDEEMIPKATMSQGPQVLIPDDMHRRPNTKFRLELGDRLSTLFIKVGVCPAMM
jgi:hypothetical protein